MKSSLIVIFNQDFSVNIEKLEALYAKRFDRIQYLVPITLSRFTKNHYRTGRLPIWLFLGFDYFLRAFNQLFNRKKAFSTLGSDYYFQNKKRIIKVLGDQYFFYHYIYQASESLLDNDSEWFWFIGDDAILNSSINQSNFFEFMNIDIESGVDAVLCKPVIGTDDWLENIQNSVQEANQKVIKLTGSNKPYLGKLNVEKEDPCSKNEHLCVACADFFGVHRNVLEKSLKDFNASIKERLFVEVCVPNVLLKHANKPISFSNFSWYTQPTDDELVSMKQQLRNDTTVFSHPIKLSTMSLDEIEPNNEVF